jgi:CRP/FNR family transcriptional regulator, cyclic AMP receptor protein
MSKAGESVRGDLPLQATPAGESVRHSALATFFEQCHRRTYPANALVVSAGEHSNALFYLVGGSVSVLYEDDDGHEIVLAYLGEGDFFGEIGLFDEHHQRSAFVRTRRRSEIAMLSYERLKNLSSGSPEVLFAMLAQMSRRVRETNRKVGDLVFRDVAGRIARTLLDLCNLPEAQFHPDGVQVRVTRQELARLVGCSREVASRVVKGLEERGIIGVNGRDIVVFGAQSAAAPHS